MDVTPKEISCRLCNQEAKFIFSKKLLQKYDVKYFRCEKCQSLQSELPYWLEEAYGGTRGIPDMGIAQRNQRMQVLVYFVSRILNISHSDKILDWGGGNGLLVRMLRDIGLDVYLLDTFTNNYYALGFKHRHNYKYKMILCFEVFEHFVTPMTELESIFGLNPEFLLISTGLYVSQTEDWKYLTPMSGRHVFFYSQKTRQCIADKFHFEMITLGPYTLFSKSKIGFLRKKAIQFVLSRKGLYLLNKIFNFFPKNAVIAAADRKLATKLIESGKVGEINWP